MELEFLLPGGQAPMLDFLQNLQDKKAVKKIHDDLGVLEKSSYDDARRILDLKPLSGTKPSLCELKIRWLNIRYRFPFLRKGNKIWFLSAFIKKDDRTRLSELRLAEANAKQVLANLKISK